MTTGDRMGHPPNCFTVDVEDWYHILDSDAVPPIEKWGDQESRVERNVDSLLEMLDETGVRATFFWLGWVAERHKELLRRCAEAGHEIASHGYAHLLAYEVGAEAFGQDIERAKKLLEDLTGGPVHGFRAAGFGITEKAPWAFDAIRAAGYEYDSSVFPASRGHGGLEQSPLEPHTLDTQAGPLAEFPISAVEVFGKRLCMFGGGYLRLFPAPAIQWGVRRLHAGGRPLIIYIHPREIDPEHPRLPLGFRREFKCYFNLKSTMRKLRLLCRTQSFVPMAEMVKCLDMGQELR